MNDVSFNTTDELFTALKVSEIRKVLLQQCQESDLRSEALKALLQDRYSDLLSTADEASGMLESVRSLVENVEELRSVSKELITLAELNERTKLEVKVNIHQLDETSLSSSLSSSSSSSSSSLSSSSSDGSLSTSSNGTTDLISRQSKTSIYDDLTLNQPEQFEMIKRRIETWAFTSVLTIESFRMQKQYLSASLSIIFASSASSSSSSSSSYVTSSSLFGTRIIADLRTRVLTDACQTIAQSLCYINEKTLGLQILDESNLGRKDQQNGLQNGTINVNTIVNERFDQVVKSVCESIYALAILRATASSSSTTTTSSSSSSTPQLISLSSHSAESLTSNICSQLPLIVEYALLRPAQTRINSEKCMKDITSMQTQSSSLSSSTFSESESTLINQLQSTTWCFSLVSACIDTLCNTNQGKNVNASLSLNTVQVMINTVLLGLTSRKITDLDTALNIITPSLVWKEKAYEYMQKEHEQYGNSGLTTVHTKTIITGPSTNVSRTNDTSSTISAAVCTKSLLEISKLWALRVKTLVSKRLGPIISTSLGIRTDLSSSDELSMQSSSSAISSLKYTQALISVRRVNKVLLETTHSMRQISKEIALDDVIISTLSDANGKAPLSYTIHDYLLGRPLRSLEALCVRGALFDRVSLVLETLQRSIEVINASAYSGPLHQYSETDYYADTCEQSYTNHIKNLNNPLSTTSPSTTSIPSLRDNLRNASRRFEKFAEAMKKSESTSKHIEEAIQASNTTFEFGSRLGITAAMEKKIRHTALPEALCGPAVYTSGIALLVAVGIVTIEDIRSRSSSSFLRPTEQARIHLGSHGLSRLFARLPISSSSSSLDNFSSTLSSLATDHSAWRKIGAESGWQSPFGACISAAAHFLAAELKAAFEDYATSSALDDSDYEEEKIVEKVLSTQTSKLSVGFDNRAKQIIQTFSVSLFNLVNSKFGSETNFQKVNCKQSLATAYSAVFLGQFVSSINALLPIELLQLVSTSSVDMNEKQQEQQEKTNLTISNKLSLLAGICVESFSINVTSHALEALQFNWASDGLLEKKKKKQQQQQQKDEESMNDDEYTFSSTSYTFSDASSSSAASLEWRSSHGSWMSAHVDSGGGAQVDVPVECSYGLSQSIARLSSHIKILGLLDQTILFSSSPLHLFSHLLSTSKGTSENGVTSKAQSSTPSTDLSNQLSSPELVSLFVEIGLTPPFTENYLVDPTALYNSPMQNDTYIQGQQQQQHLEVSESLRDLFASWAGISTTPLSSISSESLSSVCFLQSSMARRSFNLSCQIAASFTFLKEAMKIYTMITSSLAPSSSSSSSSVCESAILQASYDTFILGHVFQTVYVISTDSTKNSSSSLESRLPLVWQHLSKRVLSMPDKQQFSSSPSSYSDPQSLYSSLLSLIDPVERKLIEPRLVSFASSSIKSHALAWARVAPALASQTLPNGYQLSCTNSVAAINKTNSNAYFETWSLSALLVSNSATTSAGNGSSTNGSVVTSPSLSSSSASFSTGRIRTYGLSITQSSSSILLSCPIPASVISAEIEPTAVPLVPVRPPFQRISLLPTPTLSRPAIIPTNGQSGISSSSSSSNSLTSSSIGLLSSGLGGKRRIMSQNETLVSILMGNSSPLSTTLTALLTPRVIQDVDGKMKMISSSVLSNDVSSNTHLFEKDVNGETTNGFTDAAEVAAAAAAVAAQKRQNSTIGGGSGSGAVAAAKGLFQSVFELW
jgi:trimeric autotransporter adhesin